MVNLHIIEGDAPPLVHAPIRPAREGMQGEEVYQELWANLANGDHGGYFEYLFDCGAPAANQRAASICASFVTWLGTNVGRGLTIKARSLREHAYGDAFLMAWAAANHRRPGINSGVRSIEFILAEDNTLGRADLLRCQERNVPALSLHDYETVERLCAWLGSDSGWTFVDQCEAEINTRLTNSRA